MEIGATRPLARRRARGNAGDLRALCLGRDLLQEGGFVWVNAAPVLCARCWGPNGTRTGKERLAGGATWQIIIVPSLALRLWSA